MPLANSTTTYGPLARAFHWLIALGILLMIPLGWIAHLAPMQDADQIALKTALFSAHKTLGVALFLLALLRILWALVQPKPVPLHPHRKGETLLAEAIHWVLYAALVIVPLSGWVEHAATDGFAPILWPFGQNLPFVPSSPQVAETAATVHFLSQWALVGALALHIAGVLKHTVLDRDATLARMARGTAAGTEGGHSGFAAPLALAVLIWAGVIGGGAAAGYFTQEGAPDAPALEAAASDWQVQEGTLSIALVQMGSEVTGSFADWTAAITFEPQDAPGKSGEVTVQIAIPSLTLGSVTKQAMGADFFDAETYPTATFQADLMNVADGYVAEGTLSLKGVDLPVSLPFTLTLDGDRAEMTGRTTLDRMGFAIGANMADPGQLSHEVEVIVALTATRSAE
ncbi:cytochrome b/b6 domain-containing protein [Salipiger sp. P9]|uniref:cytochrome b/b6 domain-containing protein n=1 Tax=Salipiger pentaromativorans TaxID=2943193 RepID=UPI00215878D1|nr:cytochrome b/b6 domain-containing protein [Salipiger pentaromativorans]MCR8550214.1 cytochrome b/b6 domain-containing protein [Salipiger pentaromativorans]